MIIDWATLYARLVPTVIEPALPKVNVLEDDVRYLSPLRPEVPLEPVAPEVPLAAPKNPNPSPPKNVVIHSNF